MARPEKTAVVEEITTKLSEADAAVLTEYRGLTVSELADLRGALRPANAEYKVFKNTLARLAVDAAGLKDLLPMLEGPVAFAFVHGDAVVAAKALRDFGRGNPALVIKGGLLGPQVMTAAEIATLADIEPREVLLAKLAGGFQAPLVKAAGLFQAFTRNFAYGVQAYIDQRVEGGEAAEAPAADAAETEAAETETTETETTETETTETTETPESDAERAAADGVPPAAASDATKEES